MKKKIVVFFTVFISMFIKIQLITVTAINFESIGKIGSTGSYIGSGGNHNGFQGFRITVCETTPEFNCIYRKDIHNGGDYCNHTLHSSNGYSKLEYYKKGYKYVDLSANKHECDTKKYSLLANPIEPLPACLKYYLDGDCDISKVFTDTVNGKLYATDFFKNVLMESGYTCLSNGEGCKDGQIITVEPMFDLVVSGVEYFGTGFEMATVFNMSSNGLKFHSGTFNATYSMYLTQEYDVLQAGDTSNIDKKSTSVSYSTFASHLAGKKGNGINIYKVSDINHPKPNPKPKKGSLEIIKTDEAGDKLEGAKFGIYKGSTCEGNSPEYNAGKFSLEVGDYYVKEITAPDGYELSNSCQKVTVTAGETTSVTFKNYHKKISLTIKKHGNNNENLNAQFSIYKYGCKEISNANLEKQINVPNNGSVTVELDTEGYYCIVETKFLEGYSVANNEISYCLDDNANGVCDAGEYRKSTSRLEYGDSYTLEFYNEKTCVSEFNSLADKNSMASRIELYKKYKDENGFNLNQLLDLNNTDAGSACKFKEPKYSGKISCFDFSYPNVDFNERNVSNFNEIYIDNENNQIDFCLTNISIKSDTVLNKVVNAGQRIFDGKINSDIIKKCYSYQYNSENNLNIKGISQAYTLPTVSIYEDEYNYIVKSNTSPVFTSEDSSGIKCSGVTCGYQYESKYTYQYIPFNLSFGFGKGFDTFDTSTSKYIKTINGVTRYYYRNIGNTSGIFSKFMDSGEKSLVFNVNLDLNGNGYTFTSNDESCKYRVKQGLVSETLNLQFEQVNLNNPFIEKNSATTRRVGSNWHSKLITNESIDLNGDGVVNEIDEAIKKYASDVIYDTKASSMGDNYLVKYVMNDRPNSYSKDKPKYVITLTPSDIKAIRNYNDSNDYQDYEKVYCTDSNNVLCSTDFIDNLKTTDPKVCIGDACEKLSSGINFKREQTSTTVEKKKVNVTFQMRRFFGDIEGGTCEGNTCSLTVALNEGESIEFPKLNLNYKGEFQNWQNKSTGDIVLDSNIIVSKDSVYEANILQYKKYDVMTSIDGKKEKLCMVFGTKNIMEQCQKSLPTPTKDGYKFIGWSNPYISNSDLKITYVARFEILSQFKDFEVILNQNSFALNSKINIKDYITVNKIMQKGTNETRSRYINYSVVGFDTSNLEDNKKMTIYVSYNNMTYTYERSYNVVMLATDYLDFKDEAFKDKNAGRLKIHNSKGKIDSICVISNYKESKKQEVCATKKKDDFILDLRDLVPYTTMGSGTYSDFKLKIKATDGTELKCINPNKPEFVIKFDKLIFSSRHVCMCGTIGDAC